MIRIFIISTFLIANASNGYSQGLLNTHRIHRTLKLMHNRDTTRAKEKYEKITWQRHPAENQEQYFKSLYADEFLGALRGLHPERIAEIKSNQELSDLVTRVDHLIANYEVLKEKHNRFRKRYGIDLQKLKDLKYNLESQRKEVLAKPTGSDGTGQSESELKKQELQKLFEEGVKESERGFAKLANEIIDSEGMKALRKKGNGGVTVDYTETITVDGTIYEFTIRYDEKSFDPGVYYDEHVHDILLTTLLGIKYKTFGRELNITVLGTADGVPPTSLRYVDHGQEWSEIPELPIFVMGRDSVLSNEITFGQTISNTELALLRAYDVYSIIQSRFEYEGDIRIVLEDYLLTSQKKGAEYRTAGFIIIAENFLKELLKGFSDEVKNQYAPIQIVNNVVLDKDGTHLKSE